MYPKRYNAAAAISRVTDLFLEWFAALRDKQAVQRAQAPIDRVQDGNLADCEAMGGAGLEMRIHCAPGYRVCFTRRGTEIVILLAGGDKSTQTRDIKAALELARQL